MKTTLLLALIILSPNVLAKDTMLFIGGGGEPLDANETQFDATLEGVGEFQSKNRDSYAATVSFNGGHSKTEKRIKKYFVSSEIVPNFTAANYNKLIEDTIKKLSANPPQIRAGEKILIFIDSHGTEKQGEKTHSIAVAKSAMTNMNSGGTAVVNLDRLQALADLAEKNNVKMGIIDGSCHSGNSLILANSKTCVIAGSGPNHYSYADFTKNYAEKMKKGKNLEEIFHEAREANGGKGFPMISSPAGMAAQEELYPYLTPYMYYHDEYRGLSLDKIDSYLRATTPPELMCVRDRDYAKLEALVKLIEDLSKVAKASGEQAKSVNLSGLEKQIAEYKKTQDEYLRKLNQLDLSKMDQKEIINTEAFKTTKNGFTHRELLSTNFDYYIKEKEDLIRNPSMSEAKRKQARDLIEYYKAAKVTRERVIRENPQYAEQEKIIAGLKEDNDVGYNVAIKIMKEAHEAYNALYKIRESEMVKQGKGLPNPCKDFVL
jgi:hypothetical protein